MIKLNKQYYEILYKDLHFGLYSGIICVSPKYPGLGGGVVAGPTNKTFILLTRLLTTYHTKIRPQTKLSTYLTDFQQTTIRKPENKPDFKQIYKSSSQLTRASS